MKSHVSLEQAQCPVCGAVFSTGAILLDKHLSQSLEMHTVTHFQLCPEHQTLWDDGFVAFIEIEPDSPRTLTESLRTGRIMHMHQSIATQVFEGTFEKPICFVEKGLIDLIESRVQKAPEPESVIESTSAIIVPLH